MATIKVVEKNLIGQEDILYGESSTSQTRDGSSVSMSEVRTIYPVNSIAERDALDETKIPKCRLYSTTDAPVDYIYTEGAWTELPDRAKFTFLTQSQLAASTTPVEGDLVRTNSKANIFDNGGGTYLAVDVAKHTDGVAGQSLGGSFIQGVNVQYELVDDIKRPEQFGAVGDGVTDDAPDIKNASALGGVVEFKPTSKYLCASTITVPANTLWRSSAGGQAKLQYSGSMVAANHVSLATSATNVSFENLEFVGDNSVDVPNVAYGAGIYHKTGSGTRVVNCTFSFYPQSAVHISEVTDAKIVSNNIHDIKSNTVTVESGVSGINIEDACDGAQILYNKIKDIGITNGSGQGIRYILQNSLSYISKKVIIDGNEISNIQWHGITIYAGGSPGAVTQDTEGTIVTNNIIENTGLGTTAYVSGSPVNNDRGNGIYGLYVDHVKIDNNWIKNTGVNTTQGSIANASISVMAQADEIARNVTITNNTCINSGHDGIRTQKVINSSISNNIIDTWGATSAATINPKGIFIGAGSISTTVQGNTWVGTDDEIAFQHSTDPATYVSSECIAEVIACPMRSGFNTPFIRNYQAGCKVITNCTGVADGGTWFIGDVTNLVSPVAGGPIKHICIISGTTAAANWTSVLSTYSGTSTVVQTLTGAGAVNITSTVTHVVTTGVDDLTLDDGAEGQVKYIIMKTDGGIGTLTPTNLGNGTSITFDDVGDSCSLLFTNSAWHYMGGTAAIVP